MPDGEIDNSQQPEVAMPAPAENMDIDDPGPIGIDVVMKSILPIASESTMKYLDLGETGDDETDSVKR